MTRRRKTRPPIRLDLSWQELRAVLAATGHYQRTRPGQPTSDQAVAGICREWLRAARGSRASRTRS